MQEQTGRPKGSATPIQRLKASHSFSLRMVPQSIAISYKRMIPQGSGFQKPDACLLQ